MCYMCTCSHVFRRIEQLESSNENEVATLPLTQSRGMGLRSVSHGSLDTTATLAALHPHPRANSPDEEVRTSAHVVHVYAPDEEVRTCRYT